MSHPHKREVCQYGVVHAQCRCAGNGIAFQTQIACDRPDEHDANKPKQDYELIGQKDANPEAVSDSDFFRLHTYNCPTCRGTQNIPGLCMICGRDVVRGNTMVNDKKEPDEKDATRPDHYKGKGGMTGFDVIEAFELGFNLGNVVKYVLRAGKKDPTKHIEDLRKARVYLDREIDRLS